MQINVFKSLTVGFLALSSLSLAYGQGAEFATVIIQNKLNTSYRIFDYTQSGNGFFSGQPQEVSSDQQVAFTGDFYSSNTVSTAGFKLQDPNNPNCLNDLRQHLGHCYEAQFTYSKYGPVPKVQILDNSHPCLKSCSVSYDKNNPDDITVTINTSIE